MSINNLDNVVTKLAFFNTFVGLHDIIYSLCLIFIAVKCGIVNEVLAH